MARKIYYDINGNKISSKPSTAFYNKWWFWFLIAVIVVVWIITFGGRKDYLETEITEMDEEAVDTVTVENESTTKYEEYMGVYVSFEGKQYESPIDTLLILNNDPIITNNLWESPRTDKKITHRIIEGDVLTLNWN